MASAVDSRLAYARPSAVATASRLPTANRGSNNSYTTSWNTTATALSVEQRIRFLLLQVIVKKQVGKRVRHHLDLSRTVVVVSRHLRQRPTVEHGSDGLRQLRRDGGMTLNERRKLGQHDHADDAFGQRVPEQYGRGEAAR